MPSIVVPAPKKEFIFIYLGNQFNFPSGECFSLVRKWITDNNDTWQNNLDQLEKEVGLPLRVEIMPICDTTQELFWVIDGPYLEGIDKFKKVLSDTQTRPVMIHGASNISIKRVKKSLVPFL